jgi:hypothetical protein
MACQVVDAAISYEVTISGYSMNLRMVDKSINRRHGNGLILEHFRPPLERQI